MIMNSDLEPFPSFVPPLKLGRDNSIPMLKRNRHRAAIGDGIAIERSRNSHTFDRQRLIQIEYERTQRFKHLRLHG